MNWYNEHVDISKKDSFVEKKIMRYFKRINE